ncbi:MAG: primosomal protein N', partial [Actinobacteria bacterium]|nr:primosomal protein N' [Actinomycetota bacterium]
MNTIKDLIGRNTFKCILMEGLEKNEKTGIYKELCLETTNKGKKVLILTPEILFAPVLFENIKDEFRGRTGLYHSGMSDSRRFEQWFNIFNNNYDILIGTRSALFTPLNDIGLVIIDEAEDPSYKENTIIRYNAQDIAIKLGRIFKIPVIYSSKTPAVSMKYKSLNDHNFMNVIIPESHKGVPPLIKESIDLKSVDKKREDLVITNELYKAVKQELEKNNKAIIFINKRGYSTFLLCRDCGYIPKCPSCNVSYRFHRSTKKLNCHQCGKEIIYDGNCINCGGDNISFQGTGIEKVESKLKTRFKNVPIIRIDTDSTKNTRLYNETIKKIRNTRAAILVGTQILARLQGVENITLVGIINCDNMLELPDYSINEKVYQLITNIVDKVDVNNKKTRVIIQSYNPDNIVIKNFTNGTYSDFYNAELANREELFYPPFSNLVNIIVSGKIENEVKTDALKIYNELSKIKNDIFKITGPSPAPFYKINLFYRWHILLKTGNLKILNLKLSRLMKT